MPAKYTRPALFPIGPSIAYIPLSKGLHSLVDWEDALSLQADAWHAKYERSLDACYAVRMVGRKVVKMHRCLCSCLGDMTVDHINRNPLDNRQCNLRPASRAQNNCNTRLRCNNTSGMKGIAYDRGRWVVQIQAGGKRLHKRCKTLEEAVSLRFEAAKSLHGEFYHAG